MRMGGFGSSPLEGYGLEQDFDVEKDVGRKCIFRL